MPSTCEHDSLTESFLGVVVPQQYLIVLRIVWEHDIVSTVLHENSICAILDKKFHELARNLDVEGGY